MGDLDTTLGALFIGLVIVSVLHGTTLAQAWYFFSNQGVKFKDSLYLKLLVGLVVALDFVHQVCTAHYMYTFCVTRFGDVQGLTILPPSYLGHAYPTGFVTLLVQGFYVWRIWKLHKHWLLPCLILIPAFVQEGVQLYSMTVIGKNPNTAQFTTTLTTIVIVVNGIGTGVDVIIALVMIYLLGTKRTKFSRTNHVLFSIAIHSVTTGAITSICAILVVTTALALPKTEYVLMFYGLLTRMYSNSLLATLNIRNSIREASSGPLTTGSMLGTHIQTTTHPDNSAYRLDDIKQGPEASSSKNPHQGIAVKIDTQTEVTGF
ncbi:hypothetical protein DL96DRAFT_1708185 [Flagelloscypha sp. PMI_526]|nr:hypothetical protein DL96DRAFT_1708185 [Flagelloscypha sp. PMI_526]